MKTDKESTEVGDRIIERLPVLQPTGSVYTAEIIRAEDVEINQGSFRQLFSTKSKDLSEGLNTRPFFIKKTNPKNDHNFVFRRLFGNQEKQNQDTEQEDNQVLEIKNKTVEIIEDAKRQAYEIKEKAREKGYKEGYQEGLELGKSQAFEEVHKETGPLIELLSNSLKKISTFKDAVLNEMETDTLKLSMIIAKKLACREISTQSDAIVDVVKNAVKLVENGNRMVLKVNPEDLEIVEKYRPDILRLIDTSSGDGNLNAQDAPASAEHADRSDINVNLVIEIDEAISRGGCVIETQTQSLDATFETRFEEIVNAILPQ